MTSKLTRERIEQYANNPRICNINDEIREMARMALAAMDSEPVAYMTYKGYLLHAGDPKLAEYSETMPLYADPRPASTPAVPVAWDFEWASCITCEGPQNFNRVIEREAPPEWAVDEGQARNIIPLYRHAQPAPETEREPIAWLNDAYLARGVVDGEAGSEDAGPGYIPVYREAGPQPATVTQQEQMFGIGSIFKPQRVSEQEADCDDCVHYQPQICHGEGCPAISEQSAPVAYSDFEEFWSAYIHPLAQDDELKGFAWDIWCAAMLQSAHAVRDLSTPVDPQVAEYEQSVLQTQSVCTCPSGDGSLRWPCPSHPGNSLVIPDGYVMVPKEPTEEMLAAAKEWTGLTSTAEAVYIKMLAAVPQLPGSEPAAVPGAWIPVSEQPPRIGARVLISDIERSGVYEALRFDGNRFNHFGCEIIANYWMPLPAAPKQENI